MNARPQYQSSILLLIILTLAGCKPDNPVSRDNQTPVSTPVNTEMAQRISSFYTQMNPMDSPYENSSRANLLLKNAQNPNMPGNQKLLIEMRGAYELLLAGKTKESIDIFQRLKAILVEAKQEKNRDAILLINQYLAVCYLRLGEQENCQHHHNAHSCILPLHDEAVHQLTEGSSKAIEIINEILKQTPNDDNYIYLLNLAYLTLGQYPDKVPRNYYRKLFTEEKQLIPAFNNIASEAGLDDYRLSGGVIIDDFNNDLRPDIILSSWSKNDALKIYFNRGDKGFELKSSPHLKGVNGGLNINHCDYNNDGLLDIFVMRGGWLKKGPPNSLLRNNGDETFTDVTIESGLYSEYPTQTSAWADFNNDGWLDLFIGNESSTTGVHPCELYINQKNGLFEKSNDIPGAEVIAYVKGVAASDYDNDGDMDLYISTLKGNNILLQNQWSEGQSLSFINVADKAGVSEPFESFPCWFFDVNNDGWEDIFVSAYSLDNYNNFAADWSRYLNGQPFESNPPKLYINQKDGSFKDKTKEYGLQSPCFTMGSNYGDINSDGFPDFYLATGEPDYKALVPNRMFLNKNGSRFNEVTFQGGFGHIQKGHAVSISDIDNDGDNDVYCVLGGAYEGDIFFNALFENPISTKNWLKLKLEGVESNKAAIGAKIELVTKDDDSGKMNSYFQSISNSSSFGENSFTLNFNWPEDETIDHVTVIWPQGDKQKLTDIKPNTLYNVKEGHSFEESPVPQISIKSKSGHEHHHQH